MFSALYCHFYLHLSCDMVTEISLVGAEEKDVHGPWMILIYWNVNKCFKKTLVGIVKSQPMKFQH